MTCEEDCLRHECQPVSTTQRVLVVENDRNLLATLNYGLSDYGLLVTVCQTADQAIRHCQNDALPFQYVITDYDMPGMNGVELTVRLRQINPETIIIGMSGTDRGPEFLRAGANDFLQKPFAPYRLAMMISGSDLDT